MTDSASPLPSAPTSTSRLLHFISTPLCWFLLVLTNVSQVSASISVQEKFNTKFSPWAYSFFSLVNTELEAQKEGGGRLSTYNFVTASYRTGKNTKVAFRLPFTYSTAGFDEFGRNRNNEQELMLQDIFVSFMNYNLILLPFDIGVFWEGRAYAPTSEHSRLTKMISRFRNDFILSKYISSQIVVEYISKLNYFYQSQTAYENSFVDENGFEVSGIASRTKQFHYDHWFNIWYRARMGLSYGFQMGWEDIYYNKSDVNRGRDRANVHEYKIGPQIAFELNETTNFIFQISDNAVNDVNRSDLWKFKSENVEMTLLAFVRF